MASYEMPDGNEYEFSSDEEATRAMKAWSSQFGGDSSEDGFGTRLAKAVGGGIAAGIDFVAPVNLAVAGTIEGARTLFPESMGGTTVEQAAKNITSGQVPGTSVDYSALTPSTMIRGVLSQGTNIDLSTAQKEQERANLPLHKLSEGADVVGTFVNDKTNSPLLGTVANLGVATAGLMAANKGAVKISERFQKQVDPKLDTARKEYEAKKATEAASTSYAKQTEGFTPVTHTDAKGRSYVLMEKGSLYIDPMTKQVVDRRVGTQGQTTPRVDERFREPEQVPEERRLGLQAGEPLVTFQDGTTMTRAEWERAGKPNSDGVIPEKRALTTEDEFYNLLKEEEQKLQGQDVDTSEVRNPYFQGDRTANVEVDSVSGRPIFPEETKVDNTITKPDGSRRYGVHSGDDAFVTINPDSISRLWLELSPEKKAEMGLRNAEDLQNFVELHERKHMNDARENGGRQFKGETVADTETRTNRNTREDIAPLIADDSVGVARLPENFREPYDGAPRKPLLRGETKSPAELRAYKEQLERTLEGVNKKLADLEIPGVDHGTTNTAKLDAYKKQLEGQISKLQDTIEAGRKKGISFQPKSRVKPKQGGSVNFGFAEKVVDTAKKLLNRAPSFKEFAEHLGAKLDDPIAKELYNKYYGKEIVDLTPEQAAVAKIPGLKETISPELQPLSDMIERWKHETDISGNPIKTVLGNNLTAGGRHAAARTGSSFIAWNVENILNTTKRAQVTIKEATSVISAEFNKLTSVPLLKKFQKSGNKNVFTDTMIELMRVQDRGETPNIPKGGEAFATALTSALETVGLLVEAEFRKLGTPFKWRTNYLAHNFTGPFRVLVRDSSGEILGVIAGKTAAERAAAMEFVKQKMPEVEFSTPQYNKMFDNAGTEYGKRYAVGSEIMNTLSDGSTIAAQLKDTLSDFYYQASKDYYGYTKHSREMRGVFGSEGNKGWKTVEENAKDALEAQLAVIDHAYHWLAEQKIAKDMKLIDESGVGKNLPEANAYVNLYLDHAFGRLKDQAALVDTMLHWAAKTAGISASSAKEALSIARNFALVNSLSSVGNIIANLTQGFTHPKIGMSKAFGEGVRGNPLMSEAMGWIDASHIITGSFEKLSPDGAYFYKYIKEAGSADPHLIEHTIARKVIPTTGMGIIKKSILEILNGAFKLAQKESEFLGKYVLEKPEAGTRLTFVMSMAHYYKSAGMSAKEAIVRADQDLSTIFTDYSSQERAMIFQSLGEMGKFAGTVNTYKLNSYNQIVTFAGQGNVAALAMVSLILYATGGAMGLPGVDEAESTVAFLRSRGMYPDDKMSFKEWMLTKSDIISMGPLAELTSINGKPKMALQRKFTNENVIPDSIPDFIYSLHPFFTNKVTKTANAIKNPTRENAGSALREWSFGNLKVAVDKYVLTNTQTGRTIDTNKIDKDDQSGYQFTSDEWKSKALLGVQTMKEYRASQVANLDRIAREAWRTRTDDLVKAALQSHQDGNQEKFQRLYEQAIKFNKNAADTISEKLSKRAVTRNMNPDQSLSIQFAKRATSQHGVKGLQQFQKMQRNN